MVCVCCVEEKNLREDDEEDAEDVYFGDQHSGGGGLNVERLTTVRNITGRVEWRKNKLCAKNETSL